jgi:hypothetical protein
MVQTAGVDVSSPEFESLPDRVVRQVETMERLDLPIGRTVQLWGKQMPSVSYGEPAIATLVVIAVGLWLPSWWVPARMIRRRQARRVAQVVEREQQLLDSMHIPGRSNAD